LKPRVWNKQAFQKRDIGRKQQIKRNSACKANTHKLSFHFVLKVIDKELLQITSGGVTGHKGHTTCVQQCVNTQGVSGGIVNILGGGTMDYS
jgi:hypothetical protein